MSLENEPAMALFTVLLLLGLVVRRDAGRAAQ